jgi:signal peptidase I
MNLDQPWKIAGLIGLLLFLRIVWGLWRSGPARTFMLELLDSGLIAFILVFLLIRPFVVQAFYIPSGSMEPTLMGPLRDPTYRGESPETTLRRSRQGDRILVNKFIYRLNPLRRGDIVVFDAPEQALHGDGKKDFVKRLIGLPGDLIQIKRGDGVYINRKRLADPPGVPLPDYDWPVDQFGLPTDAPYRVPSGCFFVLGDNRNDSNDSHRWTDLATGEPRPEVPADKVLGKAMAIFWPPSRIGLIGDNRDVSLSPRQAMVEGKVASAQGAAE